MAESTLELSTSHILTKQLHALFQLHSNINVNRGLVNMQLAATHMSFMLDKNSEEIVSCFRL